MAKTGRYMYNERQPQQQTTTITAKQASKARQRRHHSETHLSALNNVFDFFQSLVVFVNFCNKNTYKKGRYKRITLFLRQRSVCLTCDRTCKSLQLTSFPSYKSITHLPAAFQFLVPSLVLYTTTACTKYQLFVITCVAIPVLPMRQNL